MKYVLILFSVLKAFAGTGHSGGGSLYQSAPGTKPVLVDYLKTAPDFQDRFQIAKPISVTRFAETLGYDYVKPEQLPALSLVQQRLEIWKENSPVMVSMFEKSLKQAIWRFTPLVLEETGSYVLPPQIRGGKVFTAIIYTEKYGAWISIPIWNQVGDFTQAGLLLHEAGRQMQIDWNIELTNQEIQDIVARIMLETPNRETLDNNEFFAGPIAPFLKKDYRTVTAREFTEDCATIAALSKEGSTLGLKLSQSYANSSCESYAAETSQSMREIKREMFYSGVVQAFRSTGRGEMHTMIASQFSAPAMSSSLKKICDEVKATAKKYPQLSKAYSENCNGKMNSDQVYALLDALHNFVNNSTDAGAQRKVLDIANKLMSFAQVALVGQLTHTQYDYIGVTRDLKGVFTSVLESQIKELVEQNSFESFFKGLGHALTGNPAQAQARIALRDLRKFNADLIKKSVVPQF